MSRDARTSSTTNNGPDSRPHEAEIPEKWVDKDKLLNFLEKEFQGGSYEVEMRMNSYFIQTHRKLSSDEILQFSEHLPADWPREELAGTHNNGEKKTEERVPVPAPRIAWKDEDSD